jgi:hypothetical protein
MKESNTLRGISTPSSQAQTFNTAEDAASLSNVQRAGVSQTIGNSTMSITASNEVDFAETPHITDNAGRMITEAAKARDDYKVKISDLEVSLGNAKNQGWVTVENGSVVLTAKGQQLVADRAGRQIEQLESKDAGGSCLDSGSQQAMSMLERSTRGKFLSAYLPAILHGHIDGKAPSFDIMQDLSKATGASPELLEGMMSEIATKALDSGARMVAEKEGLTGAQVHEMIDESSNATKKKWLVAVTMGQTRTAVQLVKALRRKDIK